MAFAGSIITPGVTARLFHLIEGKKLMRLKQLIRKKQGATVSRASKRLRHTAIHEAGHAIIHRLLGIPCDEASIVPNDEEENLGYSKLQGFQPHEIESAWDARGKFRSPDSVARARMMGTMAGREAEIVAFGHDTGGDGGDLAHLVDLALHSGIGIEGVDDDGVINVNLDRLRSKVPGLLRRHWRKVEAVAEALLARKTLSAAEIDALIEAETTPRERDIAERIEAARKPEREMYEMLRQRVAAAGLAL